MLLSYSAAARHCTQPARTASLAATASTIRAVRICTVSRRDRHLWRWHLITGRTYRENQFGGIVWSSGGTRTLDVWAFHRLYTLRWLPRGYRA